MYVPIAYGGLETDPITSMEVVEAVAETDAAAAWNLMIGATYGIWAAFLPEESARQIYGAPDAVVAGALRASGIAHAAAGGYRVSGRWAYASGIDHCAWWNGGCILYKDGGPHLTDTGAPHAVLVFFPATEGQRIDTWDTGGCAVRVATIMQPTISSFRWSTPSPSMPRRACPAYSTDYRSRRCWTTRWRPYHSASRELRSIR